MNSTTKLILTLVLVGAVVLIGRRLYKSKSAKHQSTVTHTENIKHLMKAAWEEAKEGTKESAEEFTNKLNAEYQEAMGWAKSKTKEGKNKAEEKIKAFKRKANEARAKGRNKTAAYFEKAAENLRTEVDKK